MIKEYIKQLEGVSFDFLLHSLKRLVAGDKKLTNLELINEFIQLSVKKTAPYKTSGATNGRPRSSNSWITAGCGYSNEWDPFLTATAQRST